MSLSLVRAVSLSLVSESQASSPKPAPPVFETEEHGLTFQTPQGSSYCDLPSDWGGSDHGTVIFLAAPKTCDGAGFPSSSRSFAPEDTPRIEIYYAYWMGEDEAPPPRCVQIGRARFLGHVHRICQIKDGRSVGATIRGLYMSDGASEAVFTLVSTPDRVERDLDAFKALVKSTRTCTATWGDGKKSFTIGTGPPCPARGRYF
jgi:hypothetical protein